jgi:hypothetical protein
MPSLCLGQCIPLTPLEGMGYLCHTCVDITLLPSGKLIVIGLFVVRRFLTGMPFMMNIEVAPVSAIACVGAIVIAFAHSNFYISFC